MRRIQQETVSRKKLRMPMMAIASDTWWNYGQDLDAAVQCSQWWWRRWRCRDCRCKHRGFLNIELDRFLSGFHITGPWRWYLGGSFMVADWRVRVLWSSGLVDRPSDRMYIYIITLSRFLDRHSCYNFL